MTSRSILCQVFIYLDKGISHPFGDCFVLVGWELIEHKLCEGDCTGV
jgi:hypothetical protein